MKSLQKLIERNLQIRVIGFDDAPFQKRRNSRVYIAGVVSALKLYLLPRMNNNQAQPHSLRGRLMGFVR